MTDSTDQKTPRQISNCAEATDAAFGPAAWVWSHGEGRRYNDWAQFRLAFDWGEATEVDLVLTADSRYRLWVNGEPAGDGPVRGWPDHYYYDRRPLAKYLRKGGNEIRVAVQHYGGSSFHIVPQKGGFRAALWIEGKLAAHTGDGRWQVAELPERPVAAPRISVQMPPFEICDARLARATGWRAPEVLPAPQPWRVERLRDVVEPLREWVPAPAPVACRRLAPTPKVSAIPILQLLYPGRVREVIQRSHACALAAVAEVAEAGTFRWHAEDWELYIDGQRLEGGEWQAEAGGHRVLAVYRKLFHNEVDAAFGPPLDGIVWRHPLGEAAPEDSPWSFLPMEDFSVDFTLDQGPNARILPLGLERFTLVGATTREGLLSAPFRGRFGLVERLRPYPAEDLVRILERSASLLGIGLADEAALAIAERSRGTPRVANRLLRRVRDRAQVAGATAIERPLAEDSLAQLGIDDHGLEDVDRRVLRCLADSEEQAVGLKTIAAAVGESEDTIEDVFEPHLLRCGFLQRTARGRTITDRGRRAIGLEPGPGRRGEPNLFE